MPEQTNKNLIVVTFPDGQTTTLDAEKGDWNAYHYNGAFFVVVIVDEAKRRDDPGRETIVALYNTTHIRSIEVKASAKEAATNA